MISLRAKAEKANLNLSRINSISHKDDYIKDESEIDSYNLRVLRNVASSLTIPCSVGFPPALRNQEDFKKAMVKEMSSLAAKGL